MWTDSLARMHTRTDRHTDACTHRKPTYRRIVTLTHTHTDTDKYTHTDTETDYLANFMSARCLYTCSLY